MRADIIMNDAATVYPSGFAINAPPGVIEMGEIQIDLYQRCLRRNGAELPVGARAFDILTVLARAAGRPVSKSELMSAVWPQSVVEENNLQVHLSNLRKTLGADRDLIVTLPRRGYKLARREQSIDGSCNNRADEAPREPDAPSLIGRHSTTEKIVDMLTHARVVTLVGSGGIGKSVLALQAARQFATKEQLAVRVVALAELSGREAIVSAIGRHFHVDTDQIGSDFAALAQRIAEDRALLVLDDADHVMEPVAQFIDALRNVSGRIRVMVTSREPLRVMSETLFRVEPLDVPDRCGNDAGYRACASVRLFLARARAVCGTFEETVERIRVVGEICRRLEGNPLAIELAASRLTTLGLEDIRQMLDSRMALLVGGCCTVLPRHQALRASFDWSYATLDAAQQSLFRRIAVFEDGFSFQAMCAVACNDGLSRAQVFDAVSDLVAKSLVRVELDGAGIRYSLSESTRIYALEKLQATAWACFQSSSADKSSCVRDERRTNPGEVV
jgi:predicted ATPase/DNA-binding winged helix-turn-helix (wHTH) protein